MEIVTKLLLIVHITAGFFALVLFWVPAFTRKGGLNHRRSGNWYVWCMWVVVTTAVILCINGLIVGSFYMAIFLGFLALITARPLWLGIQALNNKKRVSRSYVFIQIASTALVVVAGGALVLYSISLNGKGPHIVMMIFGILGLTSSVDLIRMLKNGVVAQDWLKEHLVNLCTTGIAAHTAFAVFGAQSIINSYFSSYWTILPWVAPSVIGVIGIQVAKRKYVSPSPQTA